ncbi:unnamed protein product [Didymodactylos carnosus]|uniref:MATH domain-containing protein n=1 Tax=Didymodactylos carnosus TaxID=1234261 RepID=A0A815L1H7_9BILA|nr:unnamed protein product [Didymodactylos carnosus]CAF4294689.1 unnamed protein product [Didymodactylos carnosus]
MDNQRSDQNTSSSNVDLDECQKCHLIEKEQPVYSIERDLFRQDDSMLQSYYVVDEYNNDSQPLVRCVLADWGCLEQVAECQLHDHYSSEIHKRCLLASIHYHVMISHLDQDPNTQTDVEQSTIMMSDTDVASSSIKCDKTVQSVNELYEKHNKLYETMAILTDGIQTYLDDTTRLTNELSNIKPIVDTYRQELMKFKQSEQEQAAPVNEIQMNQQIMQQNLTELSQIIENVQSTSYDGTYIWKVKNVRELMLRAQSKHQPSIYSPPFYSSPTGYKMCMRLYLNGDGIAQSTHISLFFVVMRGEYDVILKWPFHFKVTFCLLDQSGQQRHIIDSFRPDTKSDSFQLPKTQMNSASGIPKFFPLSMIQQEGSDYLKDDTMFIKCIVNFNDFPKLMLPYSLSLNPGLPDEVQKQMINSELERRQQQYNQQTIGTSAPKCANSCA